MNPAEYYSLAEIDSTHWFYAGKRAIVRYWLHRFYSLQPNDLLVDAGMGTGAFVKEMAKECRVIGLDSSADSMSVASRSHSENILLTDLRQIALRDNVASVVTMLDVLEHLADDHVGLNEAVRITRRGGLIILTVPALQRLWSDWDTALGHYRRYSKERLLKLVSLPNVRTLRCTYINTLALLPIVAIRFWRTVFPLKSGAKRAEDRIPPMLLNRLLYESFVRTACVEFFRLPIGVSLFAVLQRVT